MNRLQSLVLASAALVGLGLAANAETTTTTTTTTTITTTEGSVSSEAKTTKKPHCIASLKDPDAPAACYDTFTEVIAITSGGRITDAPADVSVAMKDKDLLARLRVSTDKKDIEAIPLEERAAEVQVLTIFCDDHFEGCTFGNHSLTYIGPACNNSLEDTETPIRYVGDAWNDDFESFRGFNNCWAKVFEHIDFRGASTPFSPELPDLGVLNDEGTSIRVS